MKQENTQVLFKSVPKGVPTSENFEVVRGEIDLETVHLEDGQVLVKNLFIDISPYMRGRMNAGKKSYICSWELNQPANGATVAEVVRSADPAIKVGDKYMASSPWETYPVLSGKALWQKIDADREVPLSYYLGVLGM
jgi:NADPH-dependent curcumin reductase CurA